MYNNGMLEYVVVRYNIPSVKYDEIQVTTTQQRYINW